VFLRNEILTLMTDFYTTAENYVSVAPDIFKNLNKSCVQIQTKNIDKSVMEGCGSTLT
jgi:hypothetical protein